MKAQFIGMAVIAAGAAAAPVLEQAIEQRDTQYRLPSTVILLATLSNGTVIGSLNGGGNFTANQNDYPFRCYYTSRNNGNDANIFGYSGCSIGSGPVDGAIFNCSQGSNQSILGQFWDRDGFVSLDGPTGTAFSINSLPASSDNVGVPLIVGGSGKWGQFKLQAKAASG